MTMRHSTSPWHPAVAFVVFGISSAGQAARNAELLENPPPAALWDELRAPACPC
jgi:hypothetical protein